METLRRSFSWSAVGRFLASVLIHLVFTMIWFGICLVIFDMMRPHSQTPSVGPVINLDLKAALITLLITFVPSALVLAPLTVEILTRILSRYFRNNALNQKEKSKRDVYDL